MKRYITEFANDIKKEENLFKGISEKVDKIIMLKSKGLIIDIEAMQLLIRTYDYYK